MKKLRQNEKTLLYSGGAFFILGLIFLVIKSYKIGNYVLSVISLFIVIFTITWFFVGNDFGEEI